MLLGVGFDKIMFAEGFFFSGETEENCDGNWLKSDVDSEF